MGYEIRYHYHEKLDDGGYNKEETLEKTCKVGDAYEDTTLDKLASVLMGQLARRDIWVIDWEVFEFKKAKVNAKEVKGGFIIKNKKFSLDGTVTVVSQDIAEAPPGPVAAIQTLPPGVQPHELLTPEVTNQAYDQLNNGLRRRVIKEVILDTTNLKLLLEVRQKGLKFTENKVYPVFSERPGKVGGKEMAGYIIYIMKDDLEREVSVSSEYFLPAKNRVQLVNDINGEFSESRESRREQAPRLMYENAYVDSMPDLNQIKKGGSKAITAARRAAVARDPENVALQRAAQMRQMQQEGVILGNDAGGMPTEMLDVRRASKSKNSLAGVDPDMAAIVAVSERKTAQNNPSSKVKGPKGKKLISPVPINPSDDLELPYEDEVPNIRKLRRG